MAAGTSVADTPVNTYTTGDQNRPAVAADGQGRFIVVWASNGQDGDGTGVFGRRFDAAGQVLGGEFPVNAYTTGNQSQPRVAADAAGKFIVVWQGRGGAERNDVFGRRFDAGGAPVGGQFQVNEGTSLDQSSPAVALAEDGSFLAVWSNGDRLAGRHFDDASMPTAGDFEIAVDDITSTYGFRSFHRRDARALPGGNFVVVWQDHTYTGYNYTYYDAVRGALFDDQGAPVSTFDATAGSPADQQRAPALAPDGDGGFVVVWGGYTYYAYYSRIYGRRFSSSGVPQGGVFNPTPAGDDFVRPEAVATVDPDRFLVVWNDPEIEGRYVAGDGTPVTEAFVINRKVEDNAGRGGWHRRPSTVTGRDRRGRPHSWRPKRTRDPRISARTPGPARRYGLPRSMSQVPEPGGPVQRRRRPRVRKPSYRAWRHYPLAELTRGYQPRYTFNRHTFWVNTGDLDTRASTGMPPLLSSPLPTIRDLSRDRRLSRKAVRSVGSRGPKSLKTKDDRLEWHLKMQDDRSPDSKPSAKIGSSI